MFLRIGEQLGVNPEALQTWVRRAEFVGGLRPGTRTADSDRITEFDREAGELRRANTIPKQASARLSRRRPRGQKVHKALHRQDIPAARCAIERLMRRKGLRGISRTRARGRPGRHRTPSSPRTGSTARSRLRC